ncbi:MAG: glucose-6-phosphate dehydrogenase [Victivallaceae bacterium]|nr:glucose-6-phosphate dehydrogenase [Victivallaceae bacterium]
MREEDYWRGNFCIEVKPTPGTLVIFGASGDLAERKLFPALHKIFERGLLHEDSRIVGCARTPFDSRTFRQHIAAGLPPGKNTDGFLSRISYVTVNYDSPDSYRQLGAHLDRLAESSELPDNRTFYLAMPTAAYGVVIDRLYEAGMFVEPGNGEWRHLVLEKPFGEDLRSAEELDRALHRRLSEKQIYRIDHYLGKDTVQNILLMRFANLIFEPVWNRNYIDNIQISATETLGVENRAGYYDRAGQLRDMFQNHMLEMLSMAAMEMPSSFAADDVRDEKLRLIRSIRPFDLEHIDRSAVRGQYAGYTAEPGVAADSSTETFAAIRLFIDNWRWSGVPFYLRSGKKLADKRSCIKVVFKSVPHSIFERISPDDLQRNILTFNIQPDEGMTLTIQAKRPGPKLCMGALDMDFRYSQLGEREEMFDAYERLLLDVMLGDQTLFIRSDIIAASWRLFTPLLYNWRDRCPLSSYQPGSDGPKSALDLPLADGREWV